MACALVASQYAVDVLIYVAHRIQTNTSLNHDDGSDQLPRNLTEQAPKSQIRVAPLGCEIHCFSASRSCLWHTLSKCEAITSRFACRPSSWARLSKSSKAYVCTAAPH